MALGGSPYGCNTLPDSGATGNGNVCGTPPPGEDWARHLKTFESYIADREAKGLIVPLHQLKGMPVYLYSGLHDSIVYQQVMKALATQLEGYGANVTTRFDVASDHAWIVDAATCPDPETTDLKKCCGNKGRVGTCQPVSGWPLPPANASVVPIIACCGACGDGLVGGWWRPPINHCTGVDLSGEMLRKLLGETEIIPRSKAVAASLRSFNQTVFTAGVVPATSLMDEAGFFYAPAGCRGTALAGCRVHVHYHCCDCNWRSVGENYMMDTALLDYAESNDIVTLFPQTFNDAADGNCWDWWGGTGELFDTNRGLQTVAVNRMVASLDRIIEAPWPTGFDLVQ